MGILCIVKSIIEVHATQELSVWDIPWVLTVSHGPCLKADTGYSMVFVDCGVFKKWASGRSLCHWQWIHRWIVGAKSISCPLFLAWLSEVCFSILIPHLVFPFEWIKTTLVSSVNMLFTGVVQQFSYVFHGCDIQLSVYVTCPLV